MNLKRFLGRFRKKDISKKYYGRVAVVFPSGSNVNVYDLKIPEVSDQAWLRRYWMRHYNIKLPKKFKVLTVQFIGGNSKFYDYPFCKKCIKLESKKHFWEEINFPGIGKIQVNDTKSKEEKSFKELAEDASYINDRDMFGGNI